MKFDTTRFGQINVKQEDITIFPEGPLGFPECTRFTLIDEDKAAPFRMLQSLDNPALAFVVVDPLMIRADYHFNVTKSELEMLKADQIDGLQVYSIVTMAAEIRDVTVNLQGPLVINTNNNLGHQFVLVDSEYTTKEPLMQDQEDISQNISSSSDESIPQRKAV